MAVVLSNVNSEAGLQKLNHYLLTRSYITGYVTALYNVCSWSLMDRLYCHIPGCKSLSTLDTKLQRMTWLSSLHCHQLPHRAMSMLQGGTIISVLSLGPGVYLSYCWYLQFHCIFHVPKNTLIWCAVESLPKVKVSRLSHPLVLWLQLLELLAKRLQNCYIAFVLVVNCSVSGSTPEVVLRQAIFRYQQWAIWFTIFLAPNLLCNKFALWKFVFLSPFFEAVVISAMLMKMMMMMLTYLVRRLKRSVQQLKHV